MVPLFSSHIIKYSAIILVLLGSLMACQKTQVLDNIDSSIPNLEELPFVLLDSNGKEVFKYWEFGDEKEWWKYEVGSIEFIRSYRDTLKSHLGSTFTSLLEKERYQSSVKVPVEMNDDRDKMNLDHIQYGLLGTIREMNLLEAQLLNHQIRQYPLFSHPTEFHAFIAKHQEKGLIRVYFAASDQGYPPQPRIIISELEKEASKGWALYAHLHNHYGNKENGFFGKMGPSLADAQYFKMLKERFNIEKALITNGFTTVSIPASNFDSFESH